MSEQHELHKERQHQEHTHHVTPITVYIFTFLALTVLMLLTTASKDWDLGSPLWNNVINLSIAVVKALLVIMFFMGVRWSTHLTKMFAIAGFVWLSLITITFGDYATRSWEPASGWYKLDAQGESADYPTASSDIAALWSLQTNQLATNHRAVKLKQMYPEETPFTKGHRIPWGQPGFQINEH